MKRWKIMKNEYFMSLGWTVVTGKEFITRKGVLLFVCDQTGKVERVTYGGGIMVEI